MFFVSVYCSSAMFRDLTKDTFECNSHFASMSPISSTIPLSTYLGTATGGARACRWKHWLTPCLYFAKLHILTLRQPGGGRSWITGLAGISGLGLNSEPCGNNRSLPETCDNDCVPVKKIGSRDSILGLANCTYSFEITNHNQHASNIKYLANLIKKYWTYFRYQKLADFLVCFPPSVRVQVRWPPSWKICLRIQLSFGFWGRAVKAFDNFSRKLAWLLKTIF